LKGKKPRGGGTERGLLARLHDFGDGRNGPRAPGKPLVDLRNDGRGCAEEISSRVKGASMLAGGRGSRAGRYLAQKAAGEALFDRKPICRAADGGGHVVLPGELGGRGLSERHGC